MQKIILKKIKIKFKNKYKRNLNLEGNQRWFIVGYLFKKIPNVERAKVAPWFGMPGGGIQNKLPMSIEELVKRGYIELITK